ncbi:DJ-1/PfpI family protein [Fodinicola feengrottensis]|uniref:DJ-1/PfpI family protein n=1 Tax=Fodinicola feengrottensis TaxID=435914 RepID=A0ABN2IA42_9ACTN
MRVEVLIYDGFDELDSLGPYEVFRHASRATEFDLSLVTSTGQAEVTGGNGVTFSHLREWTPQDADILVIPGGGAGRPGPGLRAELEKGVLPKQLREIKDNASDDFILASVCSGSVLIAAAGLLEGRPATTHHSAREKLVSYGAVLTNARVVDDGDIVTAGGITSGFELALHLIDRELGSTYAIQVEATMEYERRGTVWRAS